MTVIDMEEGVGDDGKTEVGGEDAHCVLPSMEVEEFGSFREV